MCWKILINEIVWFIIYILLIFYYIKDIFVKYKNKFLWVFKKWYMFNIKGLILNNLLMLVVVYVFIKIG